MKQQPFTMSRGILKARARRPRVELSRELQRTLLEALTTRTEAADTNPPRESPARKRPLDAADGCPVPIKRARLTSSTSPTLHQPQPQRSPKTYASFLHDFIDTSSPHTHPGPGHDYPGLGTVSTFVSEWLESFDTKKQERSRSDSFLLWDEDDQTTALSRYRRKSAIPEDNMAYTKDADGFAVPPVPSSSGQSSVPAFPSATALNDGASASYSSNNGRLVEDAFYRQINLFSNSILFRNRLQPLPEHIDGLVREVSKGRGSPEPSLDDLLEDDDWVELCNGASEPTVTAFFQRNIPAPQQKRDMVTAKCGQDMLAVNVPTTSRNRISKPKPDMLYGYTHSTAFNEQQKMQLSSMQRDPMANSEGLVYPFLVVEFKGDGPASSGNMWVATNQCMGGSATCVNMAERLNRDLGRCRNSNKIRPVNSAAFSIAMDGTAAQLYVSWKEDDLKYLVAHIRGFFLQEHDHYLAFRRHVRNIIEWGRDTRLKGIQQVLDHLLEEGRLRASEATKDRQPPGADEFGSGGGACSDSSSIDGIGSDGSKRGRPFQRHGSRGRASSSRSRSRSRSSSVADLIS